MLLSINSWSARELVINTKNIASLRLAVETGTKSPQEIVLYVNEARIILVSNYNNAAQYDECKAVYDSIVAQMKEDK